MIKGGLLLGGGNVSIALLGLARNVLIARLISIEDFGIASTFAITMAVVEMTSNIAIDRLVIQAKDGDDPRFQATGHAIQAARATIAAAMLFLLAQPLAALFGVPEVAWAYQAMAVIPLLRGFVHLDMFRAQRDMRYLPSVTVEFSAQLLATAAAIPLALRLGDYRAMLYALLLQQCVFLVVSHLVASRPYRWACDSEVVLRALSFGWPLLLNGILIFATFHGDRIIVGSVIGMTELGWFSAAFTLTLTPTLVIARTLQSFFLPQLARAQDDEAEFRRLYPVTVQAALLVGVGLAVSFAIAGPTLLIGLYGAKYAAAVPILVWLAAMQGLRVGKAGFSITALAKADTRNPLIANMLRVALLPVAWLAASAGGGVKAVVALGIAGEALALTTALLLLRRRYGLTLAGTGVPAVASICILALICVVPYLWHMPLAVSSLMPPPEAWVGVATLPLLIWSMRELRKWGRVLLRGE